MNSKKFTEAMSKIDNKYMKLGCLTHGCKNHLPSQ